MEPGQIYLFYKDETFTIVQDDRKLKFYDWDFRKIYSRAIEEYGRNATKDSGVFPDGMRFGVNITKFAFQHGGRAYYGELTEDGMLKMGMRLPPLFGRHSDQVVTDKAATSELPKGIRKLISSHIKTETIDWLTKNIKMTLNDKPYMNELDPHKGAFIRTLSGLFIDIQFPTAEMIDIEDIAHGLAGEFRFGKQTKERYTVAQHCIEMSRRAPFKLQLTALLHDAPEFVMGDMTKPLKILLDDYKRLENGLMKVIAQKYGIEFPFDPEIKRLDTQLLEWEYKNLFLEPERFFMVMSPPVAKAAFLKRFHELTAGK